MSYENYENWDTWECVNWVLNTEPVKAIVLRGNFIEATEAILKHMTMVKYTYASNIELDKINISEVINAVRDR